MRFYCILFFCIIVFSAKSDDVTPEVRDTVLLINEDYSTIKQIQRVLVRQGTHELFLAAFPETLDPSSLLIESREIDLKVHSWKESISQSVPLQDQTVEFPFIEQNASTVLNQTWVPTVSAGARGIYPVQVLYQLTGLSWRAEYDIRFRFSSEEQPQVSCSFYGGIHIENPLNYSFENAQIRLIQSEGNPAAQPNPIQTSGIYMMDDMNPLSDLWINEKPIEQTLSHEILLPKRVTLPANEKVYIPLVSNDRIRAKRLFRNDPADRYLNVRPMIQVMLIENVTENGLGFTLPSGTLRVEGTQKSSSLLGDSVWPHTLRDKHAEISLGSVDSVTAQRLPERLIRRFPQGYEADFRIRLINTYDFPVNVEWMEEPESSYFWSVLSANVAHLVQDRKLLFRPTIPAGEDLVIQYQLQYKRPAL